MCYFFKYFFVNVIIHKKYLLYDPAESVDLRLSDPAESTDLEDLEDFTDCRDFARNSALRIFDLAESLPFPPKPQPTSCSLGLSDLIIFDFAESLPFLFPIFFGLFSLESTFFAPFFDESPLLVRLL